MLFGPTRLSLFLLSAALPGGAAAASDLPKAATEFRNCQSITEGAARLACYDKTAAAFVALIDAKDLVVVERDTVRKERKRQFGFTRPSVEGVVTADVPEPTELSGLVTSIRMNRQFLLFTIADGGTWVTTEETFQPPQIGSKVAIKKGALGSYMMRYSGGAIRVRRIK